MTKEEKERKEAASKVEFEKRMQQLQSTTAPSEGQLLKAVGAVTLSPDTTQAIEPVSLPTQSLESGGTDLAIEQVSEAFSPSQRAAARVNASGDPKLEALLDTIALAIKAQRRQRAAAGLNPRVLVKVDSDIFSRVSNVSYARRLDKIAVLTYLLARYLPEAGREEPPAWLVQERPEDILNSFHLVYEEDSEIAPRFTWLEQRFGLLKTDIVAAIVTRYLPKSPYVVPPKRRPKRKRF
jgi:hypothetical protein